MGSGIQKTKINDPVVRSTLINSIRRDRNDAYVLEEFSVARGKARADVVRVDNGEIHAYEIKSDVDNLLRLPSQAAHYSSVFTTVTLVVGIEHAVKALYLIPNWWGFVIAQSTPEGVLLNEIREAQTNTSISYESVSDILSKEELVTFLGEHAPGQNYWKMSKPKLIDEARALTEKSSIIKAFPDLILNRNCQAPSNA